VAGDWDGLSLCHEGPDRGSDPAGVLWLHGYTMTSAVWGPLWEQLPGRRHVAVDLPSHGHSREIRAGETLADLADLVADRARRYGLAHLVALSFGTVLAVEVAARHPDVFASWTLAAPALAGMPHGHAVEHRYVELADLYRSRGAGRHMTTLWMSSPPAIFAGVNAREEVRSRVAEIVDGHSWAELASGTVRDLVARTQSAEDLAGVADRLTVVVGDADLIEHRACARTIVTHHPSARLEVVTGCGHLPLLEEPATVAPLLTAAWHRASR
jgi:pimeloyl-ACP methyl ester carboxylesterase